MRRIAPVVPLFLLLACGGGETPPADSLAVAPAPVAVMSEADIAGTWSGVSMLETSDSVVGRWTQICAAGSCKAIVEGQPDTIPSTYQLDADSSVGTTPPYNDPMFKARVTDRWVARLSNGKVVGTLETRLADMPDSVVARTRFEGSRVMQ